MLHGAGAAEYKHASLISYSQRLCCLEATNIGKHRFVNQQMHWRRREHNEAIIRVSTQQLRSRYTLKKQLAAHNSHGAQDREIKALKTFKRARHANVASFLRRSILYRGKLKLIRLLAQNLWKKITPCFYCAANFWTLLWLCVLDDHVMRSKFSPLHSSK